MFEKKKSSGAEPTGGRDVLPAQLSPLAAQFQKLMVYRNRDVEAWPADVSSKLSSGAVDWFALSSPSIAAGVAKLLPPATRELLGKSIHVAAISPVTAEAAQQAGLPVDVVAETYTWPGIFEAIATHRAM